MHRFGAAPSDAVELAEYALRLPGVRVEGLWSHFANADEADKTFAREQFERFDAIARALPDIPVRHIANSAGIIDLPEYALDIVRPGISLLGIYPSAEVQHDLDLRPVLTLRAQITRCREVPAGDTVSYGRTWTSERASIVGTVPLGYADGYRRGLSNRASMLVRGQRVPVVGRVTMDQTMVDLTAIGALDPGTVVTIYGRDGADQVTVNEIAALEQTIPYEITCALSARVPRLAIRHGQVHSVHTLVGDHEVLRQTAR
jgi:alanine racemase